MSLGWRIFIVFILPMAGYAVCTGPAGDAGHVIFNTTTKTMQYCNDTNWLNTGAVMPNAPQTGCNAPSGVPGEVIYNSALGVVQFCNGSNWINTACAEERIPNGGGCTSPSGRAGEILFNQSANQLMFCDSTDWVPMGFACGQTGIGISEVVAYVSSSINNLNVSTLFNGTDWASTNKRKKVIINSGVTIGSTNPAQSALQTSSSRGNILTIINSGTIAGAGGAANGGAGGNAIQVQQTSVTIINSGNIYGGGGGGGRGGNGGTGGAGSFSYSVREPSSGEYFTVNEYEVRDADGNQLITRGFYWGGGKIYASYAASYSTGGVTYYRGSQRGSGSTSSGSNTKYGIYRTYTATSGTAGGAGGNGGNGGRGQGFDGANAAGTIGSAGSPGGTNAGTGGTGGAGGAGGTWGVAGTAGSTGNTGTSGNAGSGLAGVAGNAGGPAGAAITGSGYTVTNSGTILGSY